MIDESGRNEKNFETDYHVYEVLIVVIRIQLKTLQIKFQNEMISKQLKSYCF